MGPDGAGVQRLVWDLRHPLTFKPGEGDSAPLFRGILAGPFVLPGTYQVRLRVGETEQVRSVAVSGDPAIDISTADRRTWHDTLQTLNHLMGVVHAILSTSGEVEERLGGMRRALQTQADVPGAIDSQLTEIALRKPEVRLRDCFYPPQPSAPPAQSAAKVLEEDLYVPGLWSS